MPVITENQPEKFTCCDSFKIRSQHWCGIFWSPVEYPVDEAKGQGWCDVCNATCGILCFAPKAFVLVLATPHICCCMEIKDLQK